MEGNGNGKQNGAISILIGNEDRHGACSAVEASASVKESGKVCRVYHACLREGVDPFDALRLFVLGVDHSEEEVHDAVDCVRGSPDQQACPYLDILVWDPRADLAGAYLPCSRL